MNLGNENYIWNIECTDDAGILWNSETRSFTVGNTNANTTQETTTTTPGSSSSGGGYPIFYPTNLDLENTYDQGMYQNWQIKFNVSNTIHTLSLGSVGANSASLTLASTPQTKTLTVGQEWSPDLNGDNLADIVIKLNSIKYRMANISIKYLRPASNLPVNIQKVNSSVQSENLSNNQVPATQSSEINKIMFIVPALLLIIIIIIIIAFFVFRRPKKNLDYGFRI